MTSAGDAKNRDKQLFPDPLIPGTILAEEQIRQMVQAGCLIAKGTFDPRCLDACSYDVRIGAKGIVGGEGRERDLTKDALEISPGGYAAVVSCENVHIPENIVVRINAKRSVSYMGIVVLTGTQIDPGYQGHLLFGFYNASSQKRILRQGQPICSLVFEALAGPVGRPKAADADLLHGNFPNQFVNQMANMEVLSLSQISEQIKQLDKITKDIMDLRTKYDNVLEPIRTLTTNVERISADVDKLSSFTRTNTDSLTRLETLTGENCKQVSAVAQAVQSLTTQVSTVAKQTDGLERDSKEHGGKINDLTTKLAKISLFWYVVWGIALVMLGAVAKELPKLWAGK